MEWQKSQSSLLRSAQRGGESKEIGFQRGIQTGEMIEGYADEKMKGGNNMEVIAFSLDEEGAMSEDEARSWLSEEERERAAAFRFDHHRNRYIRGRGMVRLCLGARLGVAPGKLRFRSGDRGKPHLVGEELGFNLSHSEDLAALAISPLPMVGIDLERFDRKVDVEGLARRCFRPRECDRLSGLVGMEKVRGFFWTWTAKEARMKVTGEGFALSPQKIEVCFEGEFPRSYLAPIAPRAYLEPALLHGGRAACVVAATEPFTAQVVTKI